MQRVILPKNKTYHFKVGEMSYSVLGKGKPLLMIHGSMSSDPWCELEFTLAKYYKLYLVDLPGFGSSDTVNGAIHNTDLFSDALDAFIMHENLSDVPVVGFSLGAVTAIKSASKGVLKGKLVLIGLPGNVKNKKLRIASFLPLRVRRFLASSSIARKKILIPIFKDVIGIRDNKRDNILYKAMLSTSVKSLTDINMYEKKDKSVQALLKMVKNQTCFLYGSDDKLRESTKDFVSNQIIIEGADHVVFDSQPEKTLDILLSTLERS